MEINGINIEFDKPVVMGILNVTPDSFFSSSRNIAPEDAAVRIEEIKRQGAAIIDIGGYSTRPGAPQVDAGEELRRVMSGVELAREIAPELVISVDTFRASVAEGVLSEVGECIINDISAGELDPDIVDVVAHRGVPYIAMHMRGTPADMQRHVEYDDVVAETWGYLLRRAEYLKERGIENVILDPGFGFAKTTEQNYRLLAALDSLCAAGYPVLAGVSRKSMIYKVLDTTPEHTLAGTTALNWECLRKGASILRVHDVAQAVDVAKLFDYYNRFTLI